jgi:hypothetical protein
MLKLNSVSKTKYYDKQTNFCAIVKEKILNEQKIYSIGYIKTVI